MMAAGDGSQLAGAWQAQGWGSALGPRPPGPRVVPSHPGNPAPSAGLGAPGAASWVWASELRAGAAGGSAALLIPRAAGWPPSRGRVCMGLRAARPGGGGGTGQSVQSRQPSLLPGSGKAPAAEPSPSVGRGTQPARDGERRRDLGKGGGREEEVMRTGVLHLTER